MGNGRIRPCVDDRVEIVRDLNSSSRDINSV